MSVATCPLCPVYMIYVHQILARSLAYLEVSELREGVDDDAEDDVESDGGHEDEEGRVIDHQETELGERVLRRVTHQVLTANNKRSK